MAMTTVLGRGKRRNKNNSVQFIHSTIDHLMLIMMQEKEVVDVDFSSIQMMKNKKGPCIDLTGGWTGWCPAENNLQINSIENVSAQKFSRSHQRKRGGSLFVQSQKDVRSIILMFRGSGSSSPRWQCAAALCGGCGSRNSNHQRYNLRWKNRRTFRKLGRIEDYFHST